MAALALVPALDMSGTAELGPATALGTSGVQPETIGGGFKYWDMVEWWGILVRGKEVSAGAGLFVGGHAKYLPPSKFSKNWKKKIEKATKFVSWTHVGPFNLIPMRRVARRMSRSSGRKERN